MMPRQDSIHKSIPCSPLTLIVLLALFACLNAIDLTSLPLSIDDEFAMVREEPTVWLSQGRWVVYLIELLVMPKPVLPFVPIAVFGICLAIGYVNYLRAIDREPDAAVSIMTFPIFAGFPVWSFLTEFQANTPAVGLGVLACCSAIVVLRVVILETSALGLSSIEGLGRVMLASLLVAIAAGAYQTLFLIFVTLGVGGIIFKAIDDHEWKVRSILRSIAIIFIVCIISIGAYFIILYIFRIITGSEQTYVDTFVRLDLLTDEPRKVLARAVYLIGIIYFGSSQVFIITAWSFGMTVLLSFLAILSSPSLDERIAFRFLLLLLQFFVLLAPFSILLVSGGFMPIRSLVAVPAAMWIFSLLGFMIHVSWVRKIASVITFVTAFQIFYVAYLYQTNNILARQRDATTAAAIFQRIAEEQPEWDSTHTYSVVIFGAWPFRSPYRRVETSTSGASFFEWDNGATGRVVSFMKISGYNNIEMAPEKKHLEFTDIARKMPDWPAIGSVKVVGTYTIIKLGPIE